MSKRYRFIYVDEYGNGTYKRIKKDRLDYYKKVIASNGSELE